MPETKKCPDCSQTIGETEKACPKCGCDLEVINEETVSHFERLQKIAEQRKPKPVVVKQPEPVKVVGGLFRNLGKRK